MYRYQGLPWIGQFDAVAVPPSNPSCRLLPRHAMLSVPNALRNQARAVAGRNSIVLMSIYMLTHVAHELARPKPYPTFFSTARPGLIRSFYSGSCSLP